MSSSADEAVLLPASGVLCQLVQLLAVLGRQNVSDLTHHRPLVGHVRLGVLANALRISRSEVIRSDLGEGFSDQLVGCLASHGVSLGVEQSIGIGRNKSSGSFCPRLRLAMLYVFYASSERSKARSARSMSSTASTLRGTRAALRMLARVSLLGSTTKLCP